MGGAAVRGAVCRRRLAIGESALALLVALTTWPTPARAALATTFSSWAGTAGLTSTTPLMPLIASSRLAGTPRSPVVIPAPASATLLAALQGGLLLAQVQRDTRPLETAIDTVLELTRPSRRDVPADGDTSTA